jgi:hypothetical protein
MPLPNHNLADQAMLTQIFYSSHARDDLVDGDLDVILESARRNNERLGITGVLILSDGVFFQAIEGEAEVLDELLERILADPRHEDAKVFRREPIGERNFGEWKMAYVAPTPEEFERWSGREGTTTIGELLLQVEETGDALPRIVSALASKG